MNKRLYYALLLATVSASVNAMERDTALELDQTFGSSQESNERPMQLIRAGSRHSDNLDAMLLSSSNNSQSASACEGCKKYQQSPGALLFDEETPITCTLSEIADKDDRDIITKAWRETLLATTIQTDNGTKTVHVDLSCLIKKIMASAPNRRKKVPPLRTGSGSKSCENVHFTASVGKLPATDGEHNLRDEIIKVIEQAVANNETRCTIDISNLLEAAQTSRSRKPAAQQDRSKLEQSSAQSNNTKLAVAAIAGAASVVTIQKLLSYLQK